MRHTCTDPEATARSMITLKTEDAGTCEGDHGVASQMVLSPLGNVVAMASAGGEIALVDVESGEQECKLEGFPGGKLKFDPSGLELTCRKEETGDELVWDLCTGRLLRGQPPSAAKGGVDHNMRAMFLHVMADTLGSVGVIVSTFFMERFGWMWADPVAAVFISILIVASVVPLIQHTAEVLLLKVPQAKGPAFEKALMELLAVDGVHSYQRAHFWAYTPNVMVGSVRVCVLLATNKQTVLEQAREIFKRAGVDHMSIQVCAHQAVCPIAPGPQPQVHAACAP
ncbi:hypothetical protein CYMTET_54718 [Cymbomonas tetramitiformis]|uniref:Cation efflux protein transmembrane domain-containing protein n=1 Tax=Cymbomonas tetramitiformis TaxID=36881 RepID=A0AAE0EQF4_9CHLO|nr:hypothetical protein CYMTET_54718 [Cymbomonas tetramitiformis]